MFAMALQRSFFFVDKHGFESKWWYSGGREAIFELSRS